MNRWRDTVSGEDDDRALGYLISLFYEDGAPLLQRCDHMLVMDDLFTYVDRSAIEVERLLHRHNCAVNTSAIASWSSK
jgi:hypothetical protein